MKIYTTIYYFILFFLCIDSTSIAQTVLNVEYTIGKTSPANYYFPDLRPNQTISLAVGKQHLTNESWVSKLSNPETGLLFEYSNYGNQESIGSSFSILPYLEIPVLKRKTNRLHLHSALGISYFNKNYDNGNNWKNKAISTNFTWSYRLFLYYKLYRNAKLEPRLSLGYTHHSNGHTKLPNHGLNTFLIGVNIKYNPQNKAIDYSTSLDTLKAKKLRFYSLSTGIGLQAISENQNAPKPVYAASFSYGKIYDNTYKLGLGLYYRFYQNYYNYIKDEGYLINEDYPELKENSVYNSSTFGVFINGEILMNHFAILGQLGVNIVKPFYKVDYRLNNTTYNTETHKNEIGELDTYYKFKRWISAKLGLKYYLLNTNTSPKHNFFVATNICSNLGQADYSELLFGYVYTFK